MKIEERIEKLEELMNQDKLIAEMDYKNPEGDPEIFYDFMKSYAKSLDVDLKEESLGFFKSKKEEIETAIDSITSKDIALPKRLFNFFFGSLNVILGPISFPLFGTSALVEISKKEITIFNPTYSGLLSLLPLKYKTRMKNHEYMHGYHFLVSKYLREKDFSSIDGFFDIGLMEPSGPVRPSYAVLKKFERKFIKAMIKKEKKENQVLYEEMKQK